MVRIRSAIGDPPAVSSLDAIQQALVQRLEQGNIPDGVNAAAERKAIDEAFGRVREGFEELMPKAPENEMLSQNQQQAMQHNQVGEGLHGRFAQLRDALSRGQQPSDAQLQQLIDKTQGQMQEQGWTQEQGWQRAEAQRRQAAVLAGPQEGRGRTP